MELAAAENTLLAFDPTRSHLSHIAQMFANGDFSTPMFTHDGVPPGATTMKLMKSAIHYTYEERTKVRSWRTSWKIEASLGSMGAQIMS